MQSLSNRPWPLTTLKTAESPSGFRIGLHTGEAIKEGEDFFGKSVVLAARIASEALGGQVLVSSLLKALVESSGEFEFGEGREVELKGLAGEHLLQQVSRQADHDQGDGR